MTPSLVDLQERIVELERQLTHEKETVMVLREFIRRSLNDKPIYEVLKPETSYKVDFGQWFEEKCRD